MAEEIRLGEQRIEIAPAKTDLASLERDFDPGSSSDGYDNRRAICYSPGCTDYRVERPASQPCGCRKTSVDRGR